MIQEILASILVQKVKLKILLIEYYISRANFHFYPRTLHLRIISPHLLYVVTTTLERLQLTSKIRLKQQERVLLSNILKVMGVEFSCIIFYIFYGNYQVTCVENFSNFCTAKIMLNGFPPLILRLEEFPTCQNIPDRYFKQNDIVVDICLARDRYFLSKQIFFPQHLFHSPNSVFFCTYKLETHESSTINMRSTLGISERELLCNI